MNPKLMALIVVFVLAGAGILYFGLVSSGIVDIPGIPNWDRAPQIVISGAVSCGYNIEDFKYESIIFFIKDNGGGTLNIEPLAYPTLPLIVEAKLYDPVSLETFTVRKDIGRRYDDPIPFTMSISGFNTDHSNFRLTFTIWETNYFEPYNENKWINRGPRCILFLSGDYVAGRSVDIEV